LKRNLFWLPWLILLLLGGCRALPPAPPPVTGISADDLLRRLRSQAQQVQSFQAKSHITFLSPRQNYSGTALLRGRLPASLKVNVLDFFGRTILSFATDGSEVRILSPGENKLLYGPATPANLAAFIPPTVTLPQALRLLVGALPFSSGPPSHFEFESATGRYLLEWRQGSTLTERLWVTAQGLYPVTEEWFGGAPEPRFTAELSDFGALVPDLPGKITLKSTAPKMELRFVYRDFKPNPPLTAAELTLTVPAGVTEVPLGR
jgi:hypothetical protein